MSDEKPEALKYTPSQDQMQELANVPIADTGIFSSFDDVTQNISSVMGGLIGLDKRDIWAIMERTVLDPEEIQVCRSLKRRAEHGIGIGTLDRPMPFVARQLYDYLRMKVSIIDKDGHGTSRQEVVNALASWVRVLEARDAEARKAKAGAAQ